MIGQQISLAGRGLARRQAGRSATAPTRPRGARRTTDRAGCSRRAAALAEVDPGDAADAAGPGPGPGRPVPRRWPTATSPLDRSADRAEVRAPAAGAARHRAVDRRLRRDAGARRPRRVPAHRHRRAPRADRRCGDDPGAAAELSRALAALALLRPDAPVGDARPAGHAPHRTTEGDLTCGPSSTHPVGPLRVVAHRGAVTAIEFDEPRSRALARSSMPRRGPVAAAGRSVTATTTTRCSSEARRQLDAYFARRAARSSTCRCGPRAPPSSSGCGTQLRQIGYGETATYGEIAAPARHDRPAPRARSGWPTAATRSRS